LKISDTLAIPENVFQLPSMLGHKKFRMTLPKHIGKGVLCVLIVALCIGIPFTNEQMNYYAEHPIVAPASMLGWSSLINLTVVNHTYFDRDAEKLIDVYAETNQTICAGAPLRYYKEFLQSCRCANASEVNKTIDKEFPLGAQLAGNVNLLGNAGDTQTSTNCSRFRLHYTGEPARSHQNPLAETFGTLLVLESIALCISVLFAACYGYWTVCAQNKPTYTPV
jgi:hypothetical protein